MVDLEDVKELTEYVIKYVEDRYYDDEMVSIAVFTLNHCLMYGTHARDFRAYVMRSIYNAIQNYKVEHINPLPPDILDKNHNGYTIPYEILEDDQKRAIIYKYEQDMSILEIAAKLNLTYTQTKYLLHTAHNKLRFWYEKHKT